VEAQESWAKQGIKVELYAPHATRKSWSSVAAELLRTASYPSRWELKDLQDEATSLIHSKFLDSGNLFRLPLHEDIQNSRDTGFLDIAHAAMEILAADAMTRAMEVLKGKIDKNGIEGMQKHFTDVFARAKNSSVRN
jgi:hypothetical protein